METCRERAFRVEEKLSAKALGWERAWVVQIPARSPDGNMPSVFKTLWDREGEGRRNQVREVMGSDT